MKSPYKSVGFFLDYIIIISSSHVSTAEYWSPLAGFSAIDLPRWPVPFGRDYNSLKFYIERVLNSNNLLRSLHSRHTLH